MSFKCFVGVKTSTPGNNRKHWAVEAKEAKKQRYIAKVYVLFESQRTDGTPLPKLPVDIVLTRFSTRKMDWHNLPGAMKHVIDGIADAYQTDDGSELFNWICRQEKSKKTGIQIEITSK